MLKIQKFHVKFFKRVTKDDLLTLPQDFLWCLTHMTTSGKENVGAHCRDIRYAMHGKNVR